MGLDSVEFVMSLEEKFTIEISDDEAMACATVGDFHRLVQNKLGVTETLPATLPPRASDLSAEVLLASVPPWPPPARPIWDAICQILQKEHEIPLHLITPQAYIVDDLGMD